MEILIIILLFGIMALLVVLNIMLIEHQSFAKRVALRDARILKHQDYKLYLKLFGQQDIQETFTGGYKFVPEQDIEN